MATELIHMGFSNILAVNRVVAIVSPNSAPSKRMAQEAKKKGLIIDMTNGRRNKAIIVLDTGYLVLAAIAPETVAGRVAASRDGLGTKADQLEEVVGQS